MPIIQSVLSRR